MKTFFFFFFLFFFQTQPHTTSFKALHVGSKPTWAVLPPEEHSPTTGRENQPKENERKIKTTNKGPRI
jgi:hypothetical protein